MSVVTNQPLPFGRLERENHIWMMFTAFKNKCQPSCQHSPELNCHQMLPDSESDRELSRPAPVTMVENIYKQPQGTLNTGAEKRVGSEGGLDCMLNAVSQFQITARPEMHTLQCVPRRIYSITSGVNKSQLFVAVEESSCVSLQCCGPARAFSLKGFDHQGQMVFYFERPLRVDACCFGCCLMELRAYTPQKQILGGIYQRWSMFTPLIEVKDSRGAGVITIHGSCCPCRCLSNQEFQIVSTIGENIGTIWKKWPGFNEEYNKDHEYFGLDVPLAMESQTKLLLLAATFLLNHMFFEMS